MDATSNNFNITTFCHFFAFSITLAATGVDDIPRLLQIQPGASSDLDPTGIISPSPSALFPLPPLPLPSPSSPVPESEKKKEKNLRK